MDSITIIPESITVFKNGQVITTGYRFFPKKNQLVVDTSSIKGTLHIYYRILPINLENTYAHKSKNIIEPVNVKPRNFYDYGGTNNGASLFNNSGLNINGNIARGLGFGNNQDVVVNSNLNLQMSGNLGKGVTILAAISDENNPIQPEGNTQQIQDFDKVYITLQKDSNSLTVGDVLMKSQKDNYFMKYYKKSRGVQFDFRASNKYRYHLHSDAAVSRGRFVRNEIQGTEGSQGPYRLQGANNELNIIVISGTEVVYLDGERLNRGQQNDYVIDYNSGELTFMPKKLINKFSRIVVEFQYSDRNYARSVFVISNEFKTGRWSHSVQYFSEQDNKLQPTDTSNKNNIQKILANAGDQKALFQSVRKYTDFQRDRVMYRQIDSLGNPIFLHATSAESDSVFYTVTFSLVGQGKGNYVALTSASNGRAYAWIAPVNGIPQGSYEPYIELVAPNKLQMLSTNSIFQINKNTSFKFEGAYSNYNQNTLSSLDKGNDDGFGLFMELKQKNFERNDFIISNEIKVEFANKNFKYIERFRAVEFDRIWNRQLININNVRPILNELISNVKSTIEYKHKTRLVLEGSNYKKGELFNGYRGLSELSYTTTHLQLLAMGELLSTNSKQTTVAAKNNYFKYKGGFTYLFKNIKIGADGTQEQSLFKEDTSSNLGKTSFGFNQISIFIQSHNSVKWKYKLDASVRNDYLPIGEVFQQSSTAYNGMGTLEHNDAKNNRLLLTSNYRKLETKNQTAPEQTILNRIEYNANFFKKVIGTTTYYQIGTGREQKRQFSYTLVQAGFGTYAWIDYNGNGIEELNEFEIATYSDQAKYVKVYLPTNEFIKSNTNEFNQTIRMQAPQKWQSANSFKRFATRFNTITSYKADRRITDNSLLTIINPFKLDVADTALIAVSSLIKQTTFYNRTSAKFGIEHTIQTSRVKSFLNSGFEWRKIDKQNMILRYGFNKQFNVVTALEVQSKQNTNQFFTNRNYNYKTNSIFPEIFYQTLQGFRMGLFYKYLEAANQKDLGGELVYISEVGAELRYFVINKGNIDAKITSHNINYKGNPNSPLAFDLLNGLSNGQNITWNISFGGKAAGNIQINISYEGRKTQVYKTVHIGRAEARYIF
ncbi:MAG: hypothetical protein PSX81_02155 [bacterium]|nr:hypothetical protein [bacterium]